MLSGEKDIRRKKRSIFFSLSLLFCGCNPPVFIRLRLDFLPRGARAGNEFICIDYLDFDSSHQSKKKESQFSPQSTFTIPGRKVTERAIEREKARRGCLNQRAEEEANRLLSEARSVCKDGETESLFHVPPCSTSFYMQPHSAGSGFQTVLEGRRCRHQYYP